MGAPQHMGRRLPNTWARAPREDPSWNTIINSIVMKSHIYVYGGTGVWLVVVLARRQVFVPTSLQAHLDFKANPRWIAFGFERNLADPF